MKEPKRASPTLKFTLVQGPEGLSLYLNMYRVAGPKPWGGGKVLHEWTVETDDLLEALNQSTKVVATVAAGAFGKLRSKGRAALETFTKRKGKGKT